VRHPDRGLGLRRLVQRDRRQRLDEQPAGVRRRGRPGARPAPVGGAAQRQPLARADPHVPGRLHRRRLHRRRRLRVRTAQGKARRLPPHRPHRGAQLRRPRLARAGAGRRLGRPPGRRQPAGQARRVRGRPAHRGSRSVHDRRLLRRRARGGPLRHRDPVPAVAARAPRPERDRRRARQRPRGGPAPGQHRPLRVPDDGRHRHAAGGHLGAVPAHVALQAPAAAHAVVLPRGDGGRAAVAGRPDRRLDAVTASDGLELGFAVLVAIYLALAAAVVWLLRRLTAKPERELAAR
jgi:hypothetical protein